MKSEIANRRSTVRQAHRPEHSRREIGFTLVELLVVISIIVVLLALLAPAMDQAIYQAELAVCGTSQKSVVNGVTAYALDHTRRYPYRATHWTANTIRCGVIGGSGDDRPLLRPYFSINMMNCPPAGKVDLDRRDDPNPDGTFIGTSMDLFFGWQFTTAEGGPGMKHLGDSWTYDREQFNVIVTDLYNVYIGGYDTIAHPDDKGLATQRTYYGNVGETGSFYEYIFTGWYDLTINGAGRVDINSAFTDGHVSRYAGVPWDYNLDNRMRHVPRGNNPAYPVYELVPRP